MSKILIADCETSGLDKQRHQILTLDANLYIDDKFESSTSLKIRPYKQIDVNALKVNGLDPYCKDFSDKEYEFERLIQFLDQYCNKYDRADKIIFCGYNSAFDVGFLSQFFKDNQCKYYASYFYPGSIDVMSLFLQKYKNKLFELKNLKLKTVAQYLKIKISEDKLHSSAYDIELTKKVYDKLKKRR